MTYFQKRCPNANYANHVNAKEGMCNVNVRIVGSVRLIRWRSKRNQNEAKLRYFHHSESLKGPFSTAD